MKKKDINSKEISLKAHSENSLKSKTGYMDTGNDAKIQAKARAIRNEGNGSDLI